MTKVDGSHCPASSDRCPASLGPLSAFAGIRKPFVGVALGPALKRGNVLAGDRCQESLLLLAPIGTFKLLRRWGIIDAARQECSASPFNG